jgi:hypothetical protein
MSDLCLLANGSKKIHGNFVGGKNHSNNGVHWADVTCVFPPGCTQLSSFVFLLKYCTKHNAEEEQVNMLLTGTQTTASDNRLSVCRSLTVVSNM